MKTWLVCGVAAISAGCASGPDLTCVSALGERRSSAISIEATRRSNPDASGNPLPTEIRVYQLRDATPLERATFDEVWREPSSVLGDVLISEQLLTVFPGRSIQVELSPADEATSIAVMAVVREPSGRTWRAIVPAAVPVGAGCAAAQDAAITFRLDAYRVEAVRAESGLGSREVEP